MFTAIITGLTANVAYHIGYHHDIKKGIISATLDDFEPVKKTEHQSKSFYDWNHDAEFKKSLERNFYDEQRNKAI